MSRKMSDSRFRLEKDALEVALDIKKGFARTAASRERHAKIDGEYVLGVAVWGLVLFAALSIVGVHALAAGIVAAILCWFWPVVLLFARS